MNATFQPCIVNFILQADSRYLINFVFSFGTRSKLLRHSKKVVRNKKIAKVGHGSDSPFVFVTIKITEKVKIMIFMK